MYLYAQNGVYVALVPHGAFGLLESILQFFQELKDKAQLKPIELGVISTPGGSVLLDNATVFKTRRAHESEASGTSSKL